MAITGNASYIPTMNEFAAHWTLCNTALGVTPLIVRLPDNTTMTLALFTTLRTNLTTQHTTVQSKLNDVFIARSAVDLQKAALLNTLRAFNDYVEAYYQETSFLKARPLMPGLGDGQERFTSPLVDAMTLWEKINAGTAPAGVTLPLTLVGGMTQGGFATLVSALQFAYQTVKTCLVTLTLARGDRNLLQERAYATMKCYRQSVPVKLAAFPALVAALPALSPAPGHTPVPVNASAIFVAPNSAKVVYDESTDVLLQRYELRGNVGDEYSDEDAVVIASHDPGEPREFVVPFGLNQPGAEVALKVYVLLTTGNEAGSALLLVQRPLALPLAA